MLRDSTKTRKGARKSGAPFGIRAARTLGGEYEIPVARRPAHRGSASGRVMAKWAEEVNVYGRRPEMFIVIIIINNEVRNKGKPGIVFVEENLTEVTTGRVKVKISVFCRPAAGHKPGCMNINAANGRLQNKVVEKAVIGLIAGSNEVKRSGVILGSTC